MSQIVENFDHIAPYRNQDEISDIEMADIDDGQTDTEVDVDDSRDRDEVAEEEEQEVEEEEEEEERGHSKGAYIPSFFVIARAFLDDLYITPQAQCSVDHFRNIIVPSAKPVRFQGKRPTLLDEDKLAFRRICYRFPQTTVQEIEHTFKSYSFQLLDFAETCKRATAITNKRNLEQRIKELDSASTYQIPLDSVLILWLGLINDSSDSDWERNEIEVKMLKALEAVAAEVGAAGNPTAIAIAYVMHRTPYVFPIIGGRKVEHLKANI
ncbi:hypothetical protein EDD18DRAFT_1366713 [Armillaria luteobubalina]|uniref:NADP-dependent oxidoreductase domain-containing protein n=1 Tax=Armillaria luteobubalina TaxID=153913 RepID=A0AA39UB79_9AGAR|nr:hypothetical protein EDD18DRAFT_1366713 [Armillaria luteobubalina]